MAQSRDDHDMKVIAIILNVLFVVPIILAVVLYLLVVSAMSNPAIPSLPVGAASWLFGHSPST
ncbi:MAG: hypothetical protein KGJ69_04645 [Thermoplasmata archaeon]|nr:hypothetical protein [Thermoplasmata archaeon]